MLRIKDIMTADVATVSPDTSLREAMEMLTSRRISGAPVLSGRTILGVVSNSDLMAFTSALPSAAASTNGVVEASDWDTPATAADLDDLDISETGFFSELWDEAGADVAEQVAAAEDHVLSELEQHVVTEVMSTDLVTLPSDTTVKEAADVLRRRRIHRVLVVDEGKLVGILSTLDIANAVADGRLTTRAYVFNHDGEFGGDR